ncbi:MAG TPA: hypothetical protein VFV50_03525, partial [Bdellovibrionales bacterium]|nr:hypothetical protein [Bdellovibrionales bacterium]
DGEIQPEVFYDPIDPVTLQEGFLIFKEKHELSAEDCAKPRKLLAFGLKKLRELRRLKVEDAEASAEETSDAQLELEVSGPLLEREAGELTASDEETAGEDAPATPDEVADKYERICVAAAADYLRSRAVDRLLYADVSWSDGRRDSRLELFNGETRPEPRSPVTWNSLGVKTYDRLCVLYSELQKARVQGAQVIIRPKLRRAERLRLIP